MMLLYARSQGAQNKVEAIDTYADWLEAHSDNKARYEYALLLEHHEFYARALEEFRNALTDTTTTSTDPSRSNIRFAIARVLLIADGEQAEGITEMQEAVKEGFNNIEAIEELINSQKISSSNIDALRGIINDIRRIIAGEQIDIYNEQNEFDDFDDFDIFSETEMSETNP
jgi:cell division GTPase FtsZ